MEFLVEFAVRVPDGTPESEVEHRQSAEAAASVRLAQDGHLVRLWKAPASAGETRAVGLYRADTQSQLDGLLAALPLHEWMRITVTALQPHANDPARRETTTASSSASEAVRREA